MVVELLLTVVWLLDRATGLLAYPLLYLAVLSGIFYSPKAREFGTLHATARNWHIEVSVLATLLMVVHGLLGTIDTAKYAAGVVPEMGYPVWYFVAASAVGAGGFLMIVVAVLGFVDARRFSPPWGGRTVHLFVYGGFAFGTVHAVAIGTDVTAAVRPAIVAGCVFLAYALGLRVAHNHGDAIRRRLPTPIRG